MWDGYVSDREKAQELLKTIRLLRRKNGISKDEQSTLEAKEAELAEIQRRCYHVYENVVLFLQIRRFCYKCDKEDV
jgi:hypothetical protein